MQHVSPDSDIQPEIIEFNREFVRLLTTRNAPHQELLFGMPSGWRRIIRDHRDLVAGTVAELPCLLVELAPLISTVNRPAHSRQAVRETETSIGDIRWENDVRVFAGSLLTYVWLAVRRDASAARLFLGLRDESIETLGAISLPELRRLAEAAPQRLRTRFATHPRFWPDLLRSACTEDGEAVTVAGLAALPLLASRMVIQ